VNSKLLEQIASSPGVSGREERIRDLVRDEVADLVDDTRIDKLGNLIAVRRGEKPRVMLVAHMDSIGFLVRHVDDDGFLRVAPVGGFDARTLNSQRVMVAGKKKDLMGLMAPAEKPIHLQKDDDSKKAPKVDDLFVDLMLPADEVKANVSVGDPVSLFRRPITTDHAVTMPYLDDRLGVFVTIEALRAARETTAEINAVLSVQEEVGVRGATTSAFDIEPDLGIAIDVTIAADIPGSEKSQQVSVMGRGAAIGVMDSGSISDPRLVSHFCELAETHGIDYQVEMMLGGGTDAGGVQLTRTGVPVMTLSIPTRYVHTANEMAAVSDIDATIDLLARFLEGAHKINLEW
jgi:putative aminopeptidase FrvX